MGSGSRGVFLCKSSSLVSLIPSLSSTQLRFNQLVTTSGSITTVRTPVPTSCRLQRMAAEASSSSSSVTGGDSANPPDSSVNNGAAPYSSSSASSAIDFLSLCHSLKVLHLLSNYRLNELSFLVLRFMFYLLPRK